MFAFDNADSHFLSSIKMSAHRKANALGSALSQGFPESVLGDEMKADEEVGSEKLGQAACITEELGSTMNLKTPADQSQEQFSPFADALEVSMRANGTPPIDIVMTPTAYRSRSRTENDAEAGLSIAGSTPKQDHPTRKAARKKKRAYKKGTVAALSAGEGLTPATSGDESDFSATGVFKKRDLSVQKSSSVASSPGLRCSSPSSGISTLAQQLDALECDSGLPRASLNGNKGRLDLRNTLQKPCRPVFPLCDPVFDQSPTPSSASVTSGNLSDEDTSEMTSYEISLEHDFISPDVSQKQLGGPGDDFKLEDVVRKMAATDFEPLRCLGKGTYGTVLLVRQARTGKLYAQKQFRKASLTVHKQLVEQTKTERVILESINRHPFVVKLYYAFQDHEKLYLILEYAQGGELFTRMLTERMFPEDTAAFYMAEMVLALEHLHHTVGVVYRDLKPENCLLDSEGHLLLTDFGLSKVAVGGEHRCKSITGTLEYMAPEVLLQQHYGTAVDWWSFGILGFDLLTGSSPFRANNDTKVREKILKSKLILPYFLSLDAKDLLTRLLRKEPKKRLGGCMPKDMHVIKNHRFFRRIDWKALEKRELEPPIKPLITDPELAENFATEFTDLAVSPVREHPRREWGVDSEGDLFGGFSFVGSRSLLESANGFL